MIGGFTMANKKTIYARCGIQKGWCLGKEECPSHTVPVIEGVTKPLYISEDGIVECSQFCHYHAEYPEVVSMSLV